LKGDLGGCLLAILAVLSAHATSPAAQSIAWTTDYAAALEKAKAENKPVLIDFTAEWCGWCKRLDEEVYADAAAANALKNFICVKIDVDKQSNVALAYNVQSMPRTIVLNIYGEIVGDVTGYQPLGPFLEFVSGLRDDLARKTGGTAKPDVQDQLEAKVADKPAITANTSAEEIIKLLGDRDPSVRSEAVRVIGDKPEKFQILVGALGSEFLCARITALETLRKAGAPNLAFDPWASKADRATALADWQRWVEQTQPEEPPPATP
jgi:thioredoxin-like negative regulator of GroEL